LFGFVMFINSWTRWHQYEGQPYHRDEFQVTRVYYQRGSKGSIDVYASGEVEDNREWMSLRPYLHSLPHSQGELESMVPAGTVIPVYFFPGMKGRMRVEVYADTPPAEANQRAAMTTLNHGLLGIAITGGLIFFLILLRRMCFAQ